MRSAAARAAQWATAGKLEERATRGEGAGQSWSRHRTQKRTKKHNDNMDPKDNTQDIPHSYIHSIYIHTLYNTTNVVADALHISKVGDTNT